MDRRQTCLPENIMEKTFQINCAASSADLTAVPTTE